MEDSCSGPVLADSLFGLCVSRQPVWSVTRRHTGWCGSCSWRSTWLFLMLWRVIPVQGCLEGIHCSWLPLECKIIWIWPVLRKTGLYFSCYNLFIQICWPMPWGWGRCSFACHIFSMPTCRLFSPAWGQWLAMGSSKKQGDTSHAFVLFCFADQIFVKSQDK